MGTDFFDGIVKTFSKTTKELGKTTKSWEPAQSRLLRLRKSAEKFPVKSGQSKN